MLRDFADGTDVGATASTVLVVGSGPAGLAVAVRLLRAGREVLVVESGGLGAGAEDALNSGVVHGQPYTGLVDGRARAFGGTSSLWHGQCMRLHPHDLATRPWVAGSGWPLAAAELDRHYPAAERLLDVSGRGYGPDRWGEHARLAPVPWDQRHLDHDFTEYARDPAMDRARRELQQHPRAVVLLHATAAAVLVEGGRTTGVELRAATGRRATVRAGTVVLAAGAIENARILQLSDPDGTGLGAGREHTGRHLQDHPVVRTARVHAHDHRVLQDRYVVLRRDGRRLFPKVRLSPAAQAEHGLLDAAAVFEHDPAPAAAAARRLLLAARNRRRPDAPVADALAAARGAGPLAVDAVHRAAGRVGVSPPAAVWVQVWVEQSGEADRRVVLDGTTDALGLRRAQVRWGVTDQEIATVRRFTRWIGHDLVRLGIGHLEEQPAMADDDAFRAAVGDAAHPSGTTRMSAAPDGGVVDPDLQVHGVAGLYVLGASVFPVAGYANPTLTIVALAVRLADHLGGGQGAGAAVASTSASSAASAPSGSSTPPPAQA